MKIRWEKSTVLAVLMLLAASGLLAQTTGRVQGVVTDPQGNPLPGVQVTATSENMAGEKVVTTEADGSFRLLSLPPGSYVVRAAIDGFNTVEQPSVQVGIDRTVTLELQLDEAFAGEITVTGAAPVVDISTSSTGINVTSETFEKVPLARSFYEVAQLATGTAKDNTNTNPANPQDPVSSLGPTVNGSTGAENSYVIDGLNTTGVELGTTSKTLNFEFIEEVEVKTGGLPAEYGRMTGGVINAITKSGGNEFHGDVFGYFAGGSLQSDDSTAAERPETTTQVVDVDGESDLGLDVGGYLVKDKLWFFAAYDRVDRTDTTTVIRAIDSPGSPAPGAEIDADTTRDLYAAKLTYRLSPNHNLSASIFGDPSTREGYAFTVSGPPSTWDGRIETGSDDYVARYDGVFGGSWVVEALAGRHQEEAFTTGPGADITQVINQTVVPTALSGGFGFWTDQEFQRDVFKVDVSKFVGDHEIKVGGDLEELDALNIAHNGGGGQRLYVLPSTAAGGGGVEYRHRIFVDDRAPGFDADDPTTWQLVDTASEPTTEATSFYAQDNWRVLPNLTVNLGLRYETLELLDRDGLTAVDIDDSWAPRLGIVWDVQNNGRSKLYANAGRFYETIPMDMNIRAFGGELQCFCYNFDSNPANFIPDDNTQRRSSLLGGATPVDPDLEGQYIDEVLAGYEYELRPNLAIGVQGTYRELGQVIEDFLVISEGTYFIANPGSGIGSEMTFYDYTPVDAPKAKRKYTALELNLRKRYSDNWQMFASYVYSKLEGNYDGTFQVSTGQLDPNINSAFDYADFLVNADGLLSNDRKHQFKVVGSYTLDAGLLKGANLGASAWWRGGVPLNAYGYSSAYANNEYYLAPRGSVGRGPDSYELDLHAGYPLQIGQWELNVLVDVFNVLDRQSPVLLDERYNRAQDGACAGIPEEQCNHDGGWVAQPGGIDPVGSIDNPRATAPNPDYLRKAFTFTQPRSIRLGVRLSF